MRMVSQGAVAVAFAVTSYLSACGFAGAAQPHHLYIGGKRIVLRYELKDGIPSAKPDLVIDGWGYLAGVAPNGTVYTSEGQRTFYAFHAGSKKPYRRFVIPFVGGCSGNQFVTGTTVDQRNNFWVTIEPFSIGIRPDLEGALPCIAAMGFSPNAQGYPQPISAFEIDGQYGIAIDKKGEMFLDATGSQSQRVEEYVDILKNPTQSKVYQGPSLDDYGAPLATDESDDLYVFTLLPGGNYGIAVWTPAADPSGAPSWVLDTGGKNTVNDFTVGERYLYAVDPASKSIDVYHAHRNGIQHPFASVVVPNIAYEIFSGP